MRVILVRHGEAADEPYPEILRPLTFSGRKAVRRLARKIANLDLRVDRIVSSPLTRAVQTAEILLCGLRKKHPVREVDCRIELASDFLPLPFGREGFLSFLAEVFPDNLLIVGHEPELLSLARHLSTDSSGTDLPSGIKKGAGLLFDWDPETGGIFHGRISPR